MCSFSRFLYSKQAQILLKWLKESKQVTTDQNGKKNMDAKERESYGKLRQKKRKSIDQNEVHVPLTQLISGENKLPC